MGSVMMYELLGVSKERAEELSEATERILFMSSLNLDEAIVEIAKLAKTKEEAFLLGNLYRYYYDIISANLSKVMTNVSDEESDNTQT